MTFPRFYMRMVEFIGAPLMIFIALGGLDFIGFNKLFYSDSPKHSASTRAHTPQIRFDGYDIQPGRDVHAAILAAQGLRAQIKGSYLLIALDRIRVGLPGGVQAADYKNLTAYIYAASQKKLGHYTDREVRGTLSRQQPVQYIRNWTAKIAGDVSICRVTSCRIRLVLSVQRGKYAPHSVNTPLVPFEITAPENEGLIIETPATTASKYWDTYYQDAVAAKQRKNYAKARRLYGEAAQLLETSQQQNHPALARIQYNLGLIELKQGKKAEYERRMKNAYQILDGHSDADVEQLLRPIPGARLDKELVARKLGDYFWDQRDYNNSYVYYKKGYLAISELQTNETMRNVKLAYGSAGVMKTACMLGKEDEAKQAMKELKQRYSDVGSGTKKKLDYWVESGDTFIKAGRCRK